MTEHDESTAGDRPGRRRWRAIAEASRDAGDAAPGDRGPAPGPRDLRPRAGRGQGQRPAHGRDGREPDPRRDLTRWSPTTPDAALEVIIDDRQINEVQRKATAMIAATIATQQPVARDLRYLLTLDHVSYELERMGDHASSVAKQARKLAPYAPLKDYVDLPRLGELVADLVRGIIRALVDIDETRAREVAALDDRGRRPVPRDLRRGRCASCARTR